MTDNLTQTMAMLKNTTGVDMQEILKRYTSNATGSAPAASASTEGGSTD